MGRPLRAAEGGLVYHVLNRANARQPLFQKDADYAAFEKVLLQAHERVPIRILAYCLMPNHWHLVLWPEKGSELSAFTAWVTLTHTQRWHAQYHNAGEGHLYQGRFKSFPVATDEHLWVVCRYVERNALRAGLVKRAEDWRWSSLWRRRRRKEPDAKAWLSSWPLQYPGNWVRWVNEAQNEQELAALRRSVQRGQPFGSVYWVEETVKALGLQTTMRGRGRPKKVKKGS